MSKVDEFKAETERLPGEEAAELFHWLSERSWQVWDRQIKAASKAVSLAFLGPKAPSRNCECTTPIRRRYFSGLRLAVSFGPTTSTIRGAEG